MVTVRSELEVELCRIRSHMAHDYLIDGDVYYVPADSLVYNFGITEIDGVKIELDPDTIYEVRGD